MAGIGLAAAGIPATGGIDVKEKDRSEVEKTRSYNPDMEYRRLGQTGLWVSAVCLGGHWKRIDKSIGTQSDFKGYTEHPAAAAHEWELFHNNRRDIISKCLDVGINLVDCAATTEPPVYARALKGRRDQMYVAVTWGVAEFRKPEGRNAAAMLKIFEEGLRKTGLEYVDIWRVMALERGGLHSDADAEEMVKALSIAKERDWCRFTGMSTHDRIWAKEIIETYPDIIQVLCIPYTADSRVLPTDSLFDTVKKQDVGVLGIKPFSSNSLFKGDGSPDSPHAEEDDKRARLAIRYILANPAITAPIPGLISDHQIDNMVLAIQERRKLGHVEELERQKAAEEMWANLPDHYQWLNDWKHV